jgi:uncharacterized protein (DUF983 family)
MRVSQGEIFARGLQQRCPNCGGRHLFKPGKHFELNERCPDCDLKLERDEGGFLASMALNYGVTVVVFLAPVALLWYVGLLGGVVASALAFAGSIVVPILLYRSSRSWWLANYYVFFPHHLPANRDSAPPTDGDEND